MRRDANLRRSQYWNPIGDPFVFGPSSFTRHRREIVAAMNDDGKIVAVGLLTQTNLSMLGSSLKIVFRVDQDTAEFDELLHALDRIGEQNPG